MKESRQEDIRKQLQPFRKQIDSIDDQILKLLAKRFGIVKKVAGIKKKHDIPAFLADRVNEVRDRNTKTAYKYGIDGELIRTIYTLIIYHSCVVEEAIKAAGKKKK
jgi:chorismate mutase